MIIKEQYITKHRMYTIAGFVSLAFWTFAFIFALRQGWGDFWNAILPICLICIPIITFSVLMLMMSLLWYVKIDGDTVTIRNMFGITKNTISMICGLKQKILIRRERRKFISI